MIFNQALFISIAEAILLIPLLYQFNQFIFKVIKNKHQFFNIKLMNTLFVYHLFFGIFYYIYAFFNPSDSHKYFTWPQNINKSWLDFLGTETTFINFISYPFINGLGFSYEMMMLLFTWIGFMGFVFAYLFFKENIKLNVTVFKRVDLLTLILFLPNMHFWTASLGKGSLIFFGLMLFAYSITNFKQRFLELLISLVLVFLIRPHIFLLMVVGAVCGFLTTQDQMEWRKKIIICGILLMSIFLLQEQILSVVKLNSSTDLWKDFIAFTNKRAASLDDAGSGVNMAGYSLPEKFFTFWFRPLFYDAPGILGIIISIENFIYLMLFRKIFKINFIKVLKNAPANVKMSMILFLLVSFAMTFVMSNLGIIIRQKSMVMYFLFFVIYYFLAHEKANISSLQKTNNSEANLLSA